MNASSSDLGLLVMVGILVVTTLGTMNRWRPIRGESGRRVTKALVGLGAVTMLAAIAVFALILSSH